MFACGVLVGMPKGYRDDGVGIKQISKEVGDVFL